MKKLKILKINHGKWNNQKLLIHLNYYHTTMVGRNQFCHFQASTTQKSPILLVSYIKNCIFPKFSSFQTMTEEVSVDYLKSVKNDESVLIIDVREPSELEQTGTIPGSINIPLANLGEILNLSDDDFQTKFNRMKPALETPLIFSCRSGRRSAAALELAQKMGFINAKHYPGGWIGWEQANE